MSLPKRRIDIDPDTSVRDLLRLLDVADDSVTLLVKGEPVLVEVHTHPAEGANLFREEQWTIALRAMETFRELVDIDELERYIHEGRELEPVRPPVIIE